MWNAIYLLYHKLGYSSKKHNGKIVVIFLKQKCKKKGKTKKEKQNKERRWYMRDLQNIRKKGSDIWGLKGNENKSYFE